MVSHKRIGIARALIKKPLILIFDEATSALDIETTEKIMSNIFKLKKSMTIIIISHDPKVLGLCKEVIDLDNQNKLLNELFKNKKNFYQGDDIKI